MELLKLVIALHFKNKLLILAWISSLQIDLFALSVFLIASVLFCVYC
jgi:hypothetical protein